MASPKNAHAMSTYFGQGFSDKYGHGAKFNRNKARWSWDNILMDLSVKETEELVDYYFTTPSQNTHSLDWFFFNYDKLLDAKTKMIADRDALKLLRERSQERTEEWRRRNSDKH